MLYLFNQLVDMVYPRLCGVCQQRLIREEEQMCVSCLIRMPLAPLDLCHDENVMRLFLPEVVPEQILTLFFYDKYSPYSRPIHQLKYGGKRKMGRFLGRMLGNLFSEKMKIDFVVPVPLHLKRERMRGYNQAYEIALGVAEVLGIEVMDDVVYRVRNNPSQTGLNPNERRENTYGLFALRNSERIEGKHLLIVDDVITTGSTLSACAKVLGTVPGVIISIGCLGRGVL